MLVEPLVAYVIEAFLSLKKKKSKNNIEKKYIYLYLYLYIYSFFLGGGGWGLYSYCIKRKKDEKGEEKKIMKKCFRWVTSDKRFGSMIPFCIQNKNKITTS